MRALAGTAAAGALDTGVSAYTSNLGPFDISGWKSMATTLADTY